MTCGSVMTRNPSCCLPGDSVTAAARIMKQEDVGPVLVVSDNSGMELLGIVTDRDIALNVVADGREPSSTRVDSIMSTNPVSCREDADVVEAIRYMAEYQIRRIPVVDENNCVIGIISQADIARHADEEQVGELVEEISQPWGTGEWIGNGSTASRSTQNRQGMEATSALAIGALCLGFGAGLMFMFDPSRGPRRRARLADKSAELWNQRNEVVQRTKTAVTETAHNLADATRSKFSGQDRETWQGESQAAGQAASGELIR
ncbi:MAG: CBS domain-containing protein [Bryobacteraceae bacterium]|nr:CBS domain-containing protein [Bryobacteraceae bacterium]